MLPTTMLLLSDGFHKKLLLSCGSIKTLPSCSWSVVHNKVVLKLIPRNVFVASNLI